MQRKRKHEGNEDEMNEVRQGLYLMGFNVDVVDWLLSNDLDIISELNEVRRAVRLYGKRATAGSVSRNGGLLPNPCNWYGR